MMGELPSSKPGLARQFASFAGVGALGFALDAGVFLLANVLMGKPYLSRFLSAACSMTLTWALNRRLTFADRKSPEMAAEYGRYLVAQTLGLGVNLGIFILCVTFVPRLKQYPILALLTGASCALLLNFLTARSIAFRGR
jgi:putative flippase GtrA